MDQKSRNIVKRSIVVLIFLVTLLIVIWLRNEIAWLFVYPWIRDKMAEAGMNIWWARLIAMPLAGYLIYLTHLILSRDEKRKRLGYVLAAISWGVWCVSMCFIQNDWMFDPQTGEAQKCYAETPYGYREDPCGDKVDRTFGTKVFRGDQNIAFSEYIKKHGPLKMEKVSLDKDTIFFSPEGRPLYWYYEHPNGSIDIFTRPGRHPQYNTELHEVTPEIVTKIFQQINSGQQIPSNITFHSDGVSRSGYQAPELHHLKDLADALKSLHE